MNIVASLLDFLGNTTGSVVNLLGNVLGGLTLTF